jgi:hypothetical protein
VSGVDYAGLMVAVVTALAEAAGSGRVITRTYADFDARPEPDLVAGLYTVLAAGVREYPWDRCDSADDASGPGATALPVFMFRVLGQGLLPEGADGAAIEAAEFAMVSEVEALADALVTDDSLDQHEELCRVVLKGIDQSQQLEAPYYWIAALFALEVR